MILLIALTSLLWLKKDLLMNGHKLGLEFDKLLGLFEQTQVALQSQAARSVDIALVVRNWLFGWYIAEFEISGTDRAEQYGKRMIDRLSERLLSNGVKGMSATNLRKFREFYQGYAKIQQTLPVTSSKEAKEIQQIVSVESSISPLLAELLTKTDSNINKILQTLSGQFSLSWSHYVVLLTNKSNDERPFYEIEAIENAWSIRELKRQLITQPTDILKLIQ